ncbi:hypothetical protein PIROE2DRAFT_60685 [Piromyces sp. E2]|nr:hypothetical protein PIROE2DRAFT_60685 [Piromyces sp. E2]|eukprot:OUM64419.1 hypothetical protein PIROE2DRAFT_60685 [Piromyces sp. E2]
MAVASAYASAEPETSENNKILNENDIKDMKGDAYFNCYKAFKLLEKDCIPTEQDAYSKTKLDSVCEKFNNEKCQNLKKDPRAALPECKDLDNRDFNDFKDFIEDTYGNVQLYCTKNEKNEYCPITNLSLFQGATFEEFLMKTHLYQAELPSDEDIKKTMEETCKSNKCREAIIESFNFVNDDVTILNKKRDNESDNFGNIVEFMDIAETAVNMVKDEKCIATANNPATNISSGSSNVDTANSTSAVYSVTLDGRVIPKISENGTDTDSIEGINVVKCNSYVTDCLPLEEDSYSKEKIDALCDGFNSAVCQNFYKDPVSAIEECPKLPHFQENNIQEYII